MISRTCDICKKVVTNNNEIKGMKLMGYNTGLTTYNSFNVVKADLCLDCCRNLFKNLVVAPTGEDYEIHNPWNDFLYPDGDIPENSGEGSGEGENGSDPSGDSGNGENAGENGSDPSGENAGDDSGDAGNNASDPSGDNTGEG